MREPDGQGDRPARRNVLVDVAAWGAALAFCLGLPALAVAAWPIVSRAFEKAGWNLRSFELPQGAVRQPCLIPILSEDEFSAFVELERSNLLEVVRPGVDEAANVPDAQRKMTPPAWVVRPRPMFPSAMMKAGIERGSVRLACRVSMDGMITACRVLEETHEGVGMAQAAVSSLCDARLRPLMVDGAPRPTTMKTSIVFSMA